MPTAMAVDELGELHRRYVDLSQRFRAAWVFHQFLQSLGKLSGGEVAPPLAGPFQELYADLKDCSRELDAPSAGTLGPRLLAIDRELAGLTAALRSEDTRWPPGALRRFFRRYKNYDGKILVQLVRFYLHSEPPDTWSADRKDKVDFLLTRLEEEERGDTLERRDEMLAGLWQAAGAPRVPEEQLDGVLRALADIRAELAEVSSLDSLEEREALRTYRDFKHSLGGLFFQPRILGEVLTTNLAFRDVVAQLYAREETRIAEEYRQVLDLGRGGGGSVELDDELTSFQQEVEGFERNLERDELRLEELAQLRRRVRSLVPRLVRVDEPGAESGDDTHPFDAVPLTAAPLPAGPLPAGPLPAGPLSAGPLTAGALDHGPAAHDGDGAAARALLDAPYRRLLDALGNVTLGLSSQAVVHSTDLFSFGLVSREVTAYRRLLASEGGRDAAGDGAELERFLLEAAALRSALAEAAETARTAEDLFDGDAGEALPGAADLTRLRRLAALGDAFLRRFDHLERQALLAGRPDEARTLAYLRVRLTRPWSDLWLLAWDDLRGAG
jgi:hypothetical protein